MSNIRNVAVLSHSGAGKTSLVEALLHRSGALPTLGSVEEGTTASDHTPEEKRRKISIYSTVHPLTWKGENFNLIDTPGYADFVGEIRGAMAAADAAMIVVSAVSGVAVGTERVWNSSLERELSTMVVVNKMDRENADFFRTMAEIESTLAGNLAAIQVPIGQAETFRGIVDLLSMQAYEWPDGEPKPIAMPDEVAGIAQEYRDRLVEAIVETDDELMLKYLEDTEIGADELRKAFDSAVVRNELTPVLLTSASKVMGISLLLDFMIEGVRRVEDHAPLRVDRGESPTLGDDAPFTARVFKTVIDPYMGKVSLMRVLGGRLKAGDTVVNTTKGEEVKTAHIYVPEGKELKEVKELTSGMIGAITKSDVVSTGDTLAQSGLDLVLSQIRMPEPVMAVAVFPKTRADEDKLGEALHRLLDADAGLRLERNADTRETVLWGMGHVHLEIATQVLKERYGVEVETRTPTVAYRETIGGTGDARYRHKKQTGGAGQFAEVALRVEPLPRGDGFEFVWGVVGGSIPTQFQSSCEKGVKAGMTAGALGGFPVQDVKVTVYDGKDHPVDSKDVAFQTAAAHAFKEAMAQASPQLLEPVMLVKVRVPDRFTGDVISDLNTRRGRILGMDAEGSVSLVSAHVPMAELQSYSAELRSMTGGRGAYSLRFDKYDPVPHNVAERVLGERSQQAARAAG
ncbi:MAG TPA: elongation factor G [Trueperaceae bacterium]|nr:elongation factor G [Trueperaceae bacterium]